MCIILLKLWKMNGLKSFIPTDFSTLSKNELLQKCRMQLYYVQSTFYYHEEDQLRHYDKYGWSALEYLEHLNVMLYNSRDAIQTNAFNSRLLKPVLWLADRWYFPIWRKKAERGYFLRAFQPISRQYSAVILNPQKVFQDYISVSEELMELLTGIDVFSHPFSDKHFAYLASTGAKMSFLFHYAEAIIQYMVDIVKNRD